MAVVAPVADLPAVPDTVAVHAAPAPATAHNEIAPAHPTESETAPTEADPAAAVTVSSNGATDLSTGNKAEPGKTGTTSSRPAQQIRTSVESAANEVN
ncbi:hypothetical protein [Mycobacterium sp. DL99]|uniref:hypothetical protein n=1 Tax=Mycobacterium sp. DL99 TaxID=2528957 RepID=UPI001080E760|nr:hypothetical protein [Mycobacterium sp. DL99]